jgi:serine/threonine protein kinase
MPLEAGAQVGPYEVVSPIGAGGMGEVYRARDPRIGREVAIKILPPGFAANSDRLGRFTQEARTVGSLNHPNLLVLFDIGSHEGSP